jgi:tRNA modification GTPase
LGALRAAGFRESLPGEFSFRAFMNGKLDLTRSESVMELVKAKTDTGREHAVGRLSGGLQREIAALNRRLVEVLAETELHLDYDEEELELPEETAEWLPGRGRVQDILGALGALAGAWDRERLYQEGALAVIAGRPNAGKSSLFNALVGEDRSIVTEIPGTTRDWIEALISVEGIPLRLADTAGLRDAGEEDLPAPDRVEQIGVERSRELLGRADLVLYVIDGVRGPDAADLAFFRARAGDSRPPILLWSKADLSPWPERWNGPLAAPLPVSAKTVEGLADLCRAVAGSLEGGAAAAEPGTGGPIREPLTGLGSGRQKELVDRARTALGEALELADRREPLDLIAPPLREAVNALGEITGEVSTADILETIFSTFCVGK